MKTTVARAKAILKEAREAVARDRTTLDLVHAGLLPVLEDRRGRRRPFRLRSFQPVGGGFQSEFADGDWQQIRGEISWGQGHVIAVDVTSPRD